jgi:membrane-associated protease RseP (regulator of RpoE activity)
VIDGALISKPVVSANGIFFWLFRCLVRVRYTFFLAGLLLGLRLRSVVGVCVWLLVVFVAVLLHELGHAFAARFYGERPHIELHAMGGHTTWTETRRLPWHQRVKVLLAGPGIGFLAGGLLYLVNSMAPVSGPYPLLLAGYMFLWVTIAWGAFNLAPMLPLDGGQALGAFLESRFGADRGRLMTRQVSVATGIVGLAASLMMNETWMGLLCGVFAFDNYQRIRGLPGMALPR